MGISTNIYTVYGIKIDWNNEFYKAYDEAVDYVDAPTIIFDYMAENYIVLGVKLFDSGDARYGFEDGDPPMTLEIAKLPEYEKEYKEVFVKKFPAFASLVDKPFNLMSFAHYS